MKVSFLVCEYLEGMNRIQIRTKKKDRLVYAGLWHAGNAVTMWHVCLNRNFKLVKACRCLIVILCCEVVKEQAFLQFSAMKETTIDEITAAACRRDT